jgi:hypothetical protein
VTGKKVHVFNSDILFSEYFQSVVGPRHGLGTCGYGR